LDETPSPRRPAQGLSPSLPDLDHYSVLSRLDAIEKLLGIEAQPQKENLVDEVSFHPNDIESPFRGVFNAALYLQTSPRTPQNPKLWSRDVIQQLWLCKYYLKVLNAFLERTVRSGHEDDLRSMEYSRSNHMPLQMAQIAVGFRNQVLVVQTSDSDSDSSLLEVWETRYSSCSKVLIDLVLATFNHFLLAQQC
jgi:hypothetical protein